jgi:hypothetical protein
VEKEAFLAVETWSKQFWKRTVTAGRGTKGKTDWQHQEIVFDVPMDAEILGLSVELFGSGTFGMDDFNLEVVDPAAVDVSQDSEMIKTARAKRNRDLTEAHPKLPERPMNLDFEK